MNVHTFLLVLAFVLLVLAGVKCPEPPYASYGWLGVALIALTMIFGGIRF